MTYRLALISVLAACALSTLSARAADDGPYMLTVGAWVCVSPEAYDQIVADLEAAGPTGIGQVMQDQQDQRTCMLIDDEMLEDTLAPFFVIEERQGDKVRVSFTVEFYKKIEFLHRRITRLTFAGWTGDDQLIAGSWYN